MWEVSVGQSVVAVPPRSPHSVSKDEAGRHDGSAAGRRAARPSRLGARSPHKSKTPNRGFPTPVYEAENPRSRRRQYSSSSSLPSPRCSFRHSSGSGGRSFSSGCSSTSVLLLLIIIVEESIGRRARMAGLVAAKGAARAAAGNVAACATGAAAAAPPLAAGSRGAPAAAPARAVGVAIVAIG